MPARGLIRPTVGLTQALQLCFDRQLEARRKNDGKACQGEEMCGRIGTPHGQQGLRELRAPHNTKTAEDICGKCSFLSTKPGSVPSHIALLVGEALRLDTLKRVGATFAYPDALPPALWTALEVLEIARAKDQEKDFQEQKKSAAHQSEQKKLEARLASG